MTSVFFKACILTIATSTTSLWAATESKKLSSKGMTKLRVKNGAGDVEVTGKDTKEILVNASLPKWSKDCTWNLEKDGDEVLVSMRATKVGADCEANFTVEAPKDLAARLHTGSGKIKAVDLKKLEELTTGSGSIEATNASGKSLDVSSGSGSLRFSEITVEKGEWHTGSGSIEFKGTLQDGEFESGSGGIDVALTSLSESAKLQLESGSGSLSVKAPKDTKVEGDFKSGSGNVTNDLKNGTGKSLKIEAQTGSGRIEILPL